MADATTCLDDRGKHRVRRMLVLVLVATAVQLVLGLLVNLDHYLHWPRPLRWFFELPMLEPVLFWLMFAGIGAGARRRWRQMLMMGAVALACLGAEEALRLLPVWASGWGVSILQWSLFTFLVGIIDMRWAGLNWRVGAAWLALTALTLAALTAFAINSLWLIDWMVKVEGQSVSGWISIRALLFYPIHLIGAWPAILLAYRLVELNKRRTVALAGGVLAGLLILSVFGGRSILFGLCKRTMLAGGPFKRMCAASWMGLDGGAKGFEVLWQSLEQADWSVPHVICEDLLWSGQDWRPMAISAMAAHDASETSRRLASLLVGKPPRPLVAMAAPLVVEHHRYEAAHVLLDTAFGELCGPAEYLGGSRVTSRPCVDAVMKMELPRASLVVLLAGMDERLLAGNDPTVPVDTREHLARLLGRDVGPRMDAWVELYDDVIGSAPSSLPPEVAVAADAAIEHGRAVWSELWGRCAYDSMARGRRERAVKMAQAAVALQPHRPETHVVLGTALGLAGRDADAIAAFDRAIALDPGYLEAGVKRGSVLNSLGNHDEAIAEFRRVLAIDPDHHTALACLALSLAEVGRLEEAHAQADAALAASPRDPHALGAKAYAFRVSGDLSSAIRLYERVVEVDPQGVLGRAAKDLLPELRAELRRFNPK